MKIKTKIIGISVFLVMIAIILVYLFVSNFDSTSEVCTETTKPNGCEIKICVEFGYKDNGYFEETKINKLNCKENEGLSCLDCWNDEKKVQEKKK